MYDTRNVLELHRRHLITGYGQDRKQPCPNIRRAADKEISPKKLDDRQCPVWIEGVDPQGQYHRTSLQTRSWDIGQRKRRQMELPPAFTPPPAPEPAPAITVAHALERFIADCESRTPPLNPSTLRKYKLLAKQLGAFAGHHGCARRAR